MSLIQHTLLLDHGNEMLFLVDMETLEIRMANGAVSRHLGFTREALIGRQITDIECALTDVFFWEEVRQGIAPDEYHAEASYLCADGELLTASKTIVRPHDHPDSLVICAVPSGQLRHTENALADASARLRATLEATADGILLVDRNGSIVNMNRQFSGLWRIPEDVLLTNDDAALLDFLASRARDPADYRRRLAAIRPDSDEETQDIVHLIDDRILERKSRPARQGRLIIGRVFSFTDITERKKTETRLKLAASVFSHAHEGIMVTDAAANIVEVNDTFSRITGFSREEVLGKNPRILRSSRHDEAFYKAMWHDLATHGSWQGEIWNRRKNGSLYAEHLSITAVNDVDEATLHYVALFSDITDLKDHQQQLERLAHYDSLTGIPNRVLLADRLHQAIAQSRRHQRSLALVYLDIDGFKEVNDAHGHETGDQLLIAIAQRLRDTLREGDTLARLGGDEFVAVLTDLETRNECDAVLSRLLQAAASPVKIRQHTLQLSASLGVTLFPQDNSDADTLLRHADQAMYQAKQAGKNRYQLFDPEEDRLTRTHQKSLRRIDEALANNEFALFFQPKVNMRTGAVIGAEALIRWPHPEPGVLPPGEFLPLIEGSELAIRVGDWVIATALAQMLAWKRQGLDLAVSVNVAANHLQQSDFLPRLRNMLAAVPEITPDRLELEVVESAALEGVTQISKLIEDCQALGVRFSLDDFGTGYSSLTYLRRLPASVLKIDQSFVRDMLWDLGDLAIVEGVIGLATAFRRAVIAEGVETSEHGELLLRLGCDLAQGYGIARPMPADELPGWIAGWRPHPAWSDPRNAFPQRDELPITYAEVDHRNWMKQLEDALAAPDIAHPELDARKCRFGQWFEGDGKRRYGHAPEFSAVGSLHCKVHELARAIVALHAKGETDAAMQRLGELRALRDALIAGMNVLGTAAVSRRTAS